MNPVTLNLVVLRSSDLERAVDFYSRLGLRFICHQHGNGPKHFAAETGTGVFELYPMTATSGSTRGTRIGFLVPSIEAVAEALHDHVGAIVSVPQDSEWGLRAVLADPDGHRIELIQQRTRA